MTPRYGSCPPTSRAYPLRSVVNQLQFSKNSLFISASPQTIENRVDDLSDGISHLRHLRKLLKTIRRLSEMQVGRLFSSSPGSRANRSVWAGGSAPKHPGNFRADSP